MGKRLTQIATRTGDNGTTGLGDNTRVSKDSLRVHAMGDVDELNSHIGLLLCEQMPDGVARAAGGDPAPAVQPGRRAVDPRLRAAQGAMRCWRWTRRWRTTTPSCPSWRSSSCRRATAPRRRRMCAARWRAAPSAPWWRWARTRRCAKRRGNTSTACRDLMFVLARVLNRMNGGDDVYWKSERLARAARRVRLLRLQHRHRDARHAGQLARVVAQVDLPDLGGAADVHRRA